MFPAWLPGMLCSSYFHYTSLSMCHHSQHWFHVSHSHARYCPPWVTPVWHMSTALAKACIPFLDGALILAALKTLISSEGPSPVWQVQHSRLNEKFRVSWYGQMYAWTNHVIEAGVWGGGWQRDSCPVQVWAANEAEACAQPAEVQGPISGY